MKFEELFLDLVYVFAVTQLSHELLDNLTLSGVVQTLILWFAVWARMAIYLLGNELV